MISTTMNVPFNQVSQTIKIECKKSDAINVPYFFSTRKENNIIKNENKVKKTAAKKQTNKNK